MQISVVLSISIIPWRQTCTVSIIFTLGHLARSKDLLRCVAAVLSILNQRLSVRLMISPVFNLDNAKDRSAAGRGCGLRRKGTPPSTAGSPQGSRSTHAACRASYDRRPVTPVSTTELSASRAARALVSPYGLFAFTLTSLVKMQFSAPTSTYPNSA